MDGRAQLVPFCCCLDLIKIEYMGSMDDRSSVNEEALCLSSKEQHNGNLAWILRNRIHSEFRFILI